MDAADEHSTQLGRRRRVDPGAPTDEEPAAPPTESGTLTRLGSRRSADSTEEATGPTTAPTSLGDRRRTVPDEVAPPAGTATSLGARQHGAPDETAAGQVPDSTGTALGARRQARGGGGGDASGPSNRPGQDDELLRFGPGVPAREPTAPAWTAGGAAATRTRRIRRSRIGGLVTIALLAAVLAFLFLRQGDPMTVQSVRVDASLAPGTCDTVVDVVGTVATNGHGGTLRYQWQRSDGQTSDVLSQSVPDKATSTQVHLQWSVSGRGRFPAQAILRVLEPTPMESAGGFTYSCS